MRLRLIVGALAPCLLALPCLAADGDVRVVVGFKGDADAGLVRRHGGDVVSTNRSHGAVVASLPAKKIAGLRASASVAYVEEDGVAEVMGKPSAKPGGSTPPAQPSEFEPWGITTVLSDGAADFPNKGANVKVAVIDTGVDLTHPDLDGNIELSLGKNCINTSKSADDDNGHGSHVAGTIAAEDNTIGVIGLAPAAKIIAIKVLSRSGMGWNSDCAEGIDHAATVDADMANMSWGSSSSDTLIANACTAAVNAGVALFAAAGNEGANKISYPAYLGTVVSVSAVNSSDVIASFSCTNGDVELSAPGVGIDSTTKDGGYGYGWNGTSMACPHAVGAAALLRSNGVSDVISALLDTYHYDVAGNGTRSNQYGWGRVDMTPPGN